MVSQKLRKRAVKNEPLSKKGPDQGKLLKKLGVKNNAETISDWKRLLHATLEVEGRYSASVGGPIIKNETMTMLEDMAFCGCKNERIQAAIGVGEMRLNFPDLADWADEILTILGTDGDEDVRRNAIFALNKGVSKVEICMVALRGAEKKERKKGRTSP